MLAALQPPSDRTGKLFSTRTMNNFQTLDIRHYITLFDNPTKRGALTRWPLRPDPRQPALHL